MVYRHGDEGNVRVGGLDRLLRLGLVGVVTATSGVMVMGLIVGRLGVLGCVNVVRVVVVAEEGGLVLKVVVVVRMLPYTFRSHLCYYNVMKFQFLTNKRSTNIVIIFMIK